MEDDKRRILFWLIAIAGILFMIALPWLIIDHAQARALESQLTEIDILLSVNAERVGPAGVEYQENHLLYADHWSAGLEISLQEADEKINEARTLLQSARDEQQSNHRRAARNLADQALEGIAVAQATIDLILGSEGSEDQGLFEQLEFKAKNAEKHIVEAENEIDRVKGVLQSMLKEEWNITNGLSFKPAHAQLTEAENFISTAHLTLGKVVERKLIDTPLTYDQAQQAIDAAQNAQQLAEQDVTSAQAARTAIEGARSQIAVSRAFIVVSLHNQASALAILINADSELAQAEQAFNDERFADALSLAEQASATALSAQALATPPVVETDDDDWDWGGGSGGYDDWGSDSGSWGSDWGSDSGGWGSDSGSWDSDWGSDSGSWDSDWGSDSGSWDSDW